MKFNLLKRKQAVTRNYEGAKAFKMTPEMELYAAVVTASLSDKFYESQGNTLLRIQTLIDQVSPEFVAKLAVYARQSMHLRSIPMVLVIELAKRNSGSSLVCKTIEAVVQRADEITELLAYYQIANKRSGLKKLNRLSKQIQKGLAASFNRFDEYQFAKYNRNTEIKLRDALFLVHPKAKSEEQQSVFNKIANNELNIPYTWETELSALGQRKFETIEEKHRQFKLKWEELIDSKKLGYMATLRNLRNIIESKVSYEHMKKVCAFLSNEQAVLNSKQLPFRFFAAFREIENLDSMHVSDVLDALESAIQLSANNIPGFDKNTSVLIACDVSGSMQTPVSRKSKVLMYDIGLVLGMMMQFRTPKVITGMFGDKWKAINVSRKSILNNVNAFYKREGEVGYSTNGYMAIDYLIRKGIVIDKIMMFTDCQMWNSLDQASSFQNSWKTYKRMAPNAKLYLFDLQGYGQTPLRINNDDVFLIAGWSDKVFEVLAAVENKVNAIEKINQLVL